MPPSSRTRRARSDEYDDFIRRAQTDNDLARFVQVNLFSGIPVLFAESPPHYETLRSHLSAGLRVKPDAITVVGSARLGYSLNPNHPGRPLSAQSDVDVIVADEDLFDRLWGLLLEWRYPWHLRHWTDGEREWGLKLAENFMAGHCVPQDIKRIPVGAQNHRRELQRMANEWFSTFKSTSTRPELGVRDYRGRLYRSWNFAEKYHVSGLKLLFERKGSEEG